MCDGCSEIDIAVPARKPASRRRSATGVVGIAIAVLLTVGEGCERLEQRTHRNASIGMIPA